MRSFTLLLAALLCFSGAAAAEAKPVNAETPDSKCLECHGVKGFAAPTGEFGESRKRSLYVEADILHDSIHVNERCVSCHATIDQIPHRITAQKQTVDCVGCHKKQSAKFTELHTEDSMARVLAGLPPDIPPTPNIVDPEKQTMI